MTPSPDFDPRTTIAYGDQHRRRTIAATDEHLTCAADGAPTSITHHENLDLREFLAKLRFWGKASAFRNRQYQLLPGAEEFGQILGGFIHWEERDQKGIALVVRDGHGTPMNLLHVGYGAAPLTGADFLIDHPIWEGRIRFGNSDSQTGQIWFTVGWQDALAVYKATRQTTIACLSLDAVVPMAREWAKDNPETTLHICHAGGSAETNNPELVELFKIVEDAACRRPANEVSGDEKAAPKKRAKPVKEKEPATSSRAVIIPAGEGLTFAELAKQKGLDGLRQHLLLHQAEQHPFPLNDRYRKLNVLPIPSRWPMRVSGEYLVSRLQAVLKKYVGLTDSANMIIALWIILTHARSKIRQLPLLGITSPEYGCGKTTLLFVLQYLCQRALGISATDLPDLMRGLKRNADRTTIEQDDYQTLLLDEAQNLFRNNKALAHIETAFDSFELGVIEERKGEFTRPRNRCACAMTYWGVSPPIRIACRSITVHIQRLASSEFVQAHQDIRTSREQGELMILRSMVRRFAEDVFNEPPDVGPLRTDARDARLEDVWRPMLQAARYISAEREQQLRAAAVDFISEPEDVLVGRELLSNIRELLLDNPEQTYFKSAELVEKLRDKEYWVWQARNLDHLKLTRMLRPYGLRTSFERHAAGQKGFRAFQTSALEAAADRYAP